MCVWIECQQALRGRIEIPSMPGDVFFMAMVACSISSRLM